MSKKSFDWLTTLSAGGLITVTTLQILKLLFPEILSSLIVESLLPTTILQIVIDYGALACLVALAYFCFELCKSNRAIRKKYQSTKEEIAILQSDQEAADSLITDLSEELERVNLEFTYSTRRSHASEFV